MNEQSYPHLKPISNILEQRRKLDISVVLSFHNMG